MLGYGRTRPSAYRSSTIGSWTGLPKAVRSSPLAACIAYNVGPGPVADLLNPKGLLRRCICSGDCSPMAPTQSLPVLKMMERIRQEGLMVIVRGGFSLEEVIVVGDALLAVPLPLLEITLNTSGALHAIEALRYRFGDHMVIGAGTVREAAQAREAIAAGAQFLVAPNLDRPAVEEALDQDTLMIPGVFTPTEVQQAVQAGCAMVKLFPCPDTSYLKAVRAPLSDVEFIPTGGIDAGNIGEFRRAGAVAVGIGSALVGSGTIHQGDLITKARMLKRHWDAAGVAG